MTPKVVSVDCSKIRDWNSFHEEFATTFGFPDFYGKNMDAWIDCMTYLDDPQSGLSKVHVPKNGVLTLQLENVTSLRDQYPDLYAAIIECSAFVNWRRLETCETAVLAISFRN